MLTSKYRTEGVTQETVSEWVKSGSALHVHPPLLRLRNRSLEHHSTSKKSSHSFILVVNFFFIMTVYIYIYLSIYQPYLWLPASFKETSTLTDVKSDV